ncbi:MAG: tetratricopeptide repeat protein [Candidatus Obscuribacterales bacterium]|nr:tetratricopeptide repeat protein [Candidatus Obscuribacterales bacterium]
MSDRESAKPLLDKAITCARSLGFPRDIVGCLCNLGCFHYLGGEYLQSEKYFAEALEVGRQAVPKDSPALAPLLDYRAFALRGLGKYELAESCYLESLQIRVGFYGYYHFDVVYSLMNLACLYFDWSSDQTTIDDLPPSKRDLLCARANDILYQVDLLMNPNPDPTKELCQKALDCLLRSRESIDDPDLAWKYRKSLHFYMEQIQKHSQKMVLVNSKARIDVCPNSKNLSHNPPVPRPFWPHLPANNRHTPQLPNMVAYAKDVIAKCKPKPKKKKVRHGPPGLATILGNWSIKTDIKEKSVSKSRSYDEQRLDGTWHITENVDAGKASQVEGVTIYLCHYPKNPTHVLRQLRQYGSVRGLQWSDFGRFGTTHGWPANNKQARQLVTILDSVASSISYETVPTDKNGDYVFTEVPKGDYLLYASVCTEKQCMVWLIPGEKIVVSPH